MLDAPPKNLRFRARVLGPLATHRLIRCQITQTIRSRNSTVIIDGWSPGDEALVILKSLYSWAVPSTVGRVEILAIEPISWRELESIDATRGGFDNLDELQKALKRAGYRFKLLEEYQLYRVRFEWRNNAENTNVQSS